MYPILKAHNLRRTIVFAATLLAAILSTPAQDSGTPQQKVSDNKIDQTMRSAARVNPSTLAVEISIPLASFPGRKGNAVPVSLNYSSKVWGMASSFTYFYITGSNRQYVTQLRPEFAKRSAAGWTTNLNIPVIEERLELFDPVGRPFSLPTSDDLFSSFINDLLHREQNNNGGNCDECDYV